MSRDLVVALSGGIGGAKLALGLSRILAPHNLIVVANVGDDFEHLGLHVSPDSDTLMYALAGLDNTKLGWGRRDETWSFMETLSALGGEDWFRLGDRDLAVHVERTRRLEAGEPLSAITADFCRRLGVAPRVAAGDRRPPCAPDCERMRDGSTSRIISSACNAGRKCGSLPSTARRMRALSLTLWRRLATNDCARWSSARPIPSSASSRSSPSGACARRSPVAARLSSPFRRSSAAARSRVRQPR